MHLSLFLSFLGLASIVLSTPIALTVRQNPIPLLIAQDVTNVFTTVNQDINATLTAVANSAKDVTAQAQLIATIKVNFSDIQSQLVNAGKSINSTTIGLAVSLTAPDIQTLSTTVASIKTLVRTLDSVYQTLNNDLTADTFIAVKAEYAAAAAALNPFTVPLIVYLGGITGVGEDGVDMALSALLNSGLKLGYAIGSLLTSVGVSV